MFFSLVFGQNAWLHVKEEEEEHDGEDDDDDDDGEISMWCN